MVIASTTTATIIIPSKNAESKIAWRFRSGAVMFGEGSISCIRDFVKELIAGICPPAFYYQEAGNHVTECFLNSVPYFFVHSACSIELRDKTQVVLEIHRQPGKEPLSKAVSAKHCLSEMRRARAERAWNEFQNATHQDSSQFY
jgi:hypothetical protein